MFFQEQDWSKNCFILIDPIWHAVHPWLGDWPVSISKKGQRHWSRAAELEGSGGKR